MQSLLKKIFIVCVLFTIGQQLKFIFLCWLERKIDEIWNKKGKKIDYHSKKREIFTRKSIQL